MALRFGEKDETKKKTPTGGGFQFPIGGEFQVPQFQNISPMSASRGLGEAFASMAEQQRFFEDYQPQRTLRQKLQRDMADIAMGFISAPVNIWRYGQQMGAEMLDMPELGTSWNPLNLFRPQTFLERHGEHLEGETEQERMQDLQSRAFRITRGQLMGLIPGFGLVRQYSPRVHEWAEERDIGHHGSSRVLHDFYVQSLIEDTGRWVTDTGSRWEEFAERPLMTAFQDFANIYPLALATKYSGLAAKFGKIPAVDKAYKASSRGFHKIADPIKERVALRERLLGIIKSKRARDQYIQRMGDKVWYKEQKAYKFYDDKGKFVAQAESVPALHHKVSPMVPGTAADKAVVSIKRVPTAQATPGAITSKDVVNFKKMHPDHTWIHEYGTDLAGQKVHTYIGYKKSVVRDVLKQHGIQDSAEKFLSRTIHEGRAAPGTIESKILKTLDQVPAEKLGPWPKGKIADPQTVGVETTPMGRLIYGFTKNEKVNKIHKRVSNPTPADIKRMSDFFDYLEGTKNPDWLAKAGKLKKAAETQYRQLNQKWQDNLIRQGKLTREQVEVARWQPIVNKDMKPFFKRIVQDKMSAGLDVDAATKEALRLTTNAAKALWPKKNPVWIHHMYKPSKGLKAIKEAALGTAKKPVGHWTSKTLMERAMQPQGKIIKNPGLAIAEGHRDLVKAFSWKKFINEIKKNFAKPQVKGKKMPRGYETFSPDKIASEMFPQWKGTGKQYWIPKWVGSEIKNMLGDVGGFETFLRMTWDKGTMLWKMPVLSLRPGWLLNNFVGLSMLNLLGGVGPIGYMKALGHVFKAAKLSKKTGLKFEESLRKLGIPRKLFDSGLYFGDVDASLKNLQQLKKAPMGDKVSTAARLTGIVQTSKGIRTLNSAIESFHRAAHYFDRTAKGMPFDKVLKSAHYFCFDYGQLGAWEKAFIRRLDPFWNWHKNIARFAATYPIKDPMKMFIIQKLQEMEEDERDFRFVADWVKSYVETPWYSLDGTPLHLSLYGPNPFSDVMFSPGFLHPALKMGIERMTGQQMFGERPFSAPHQEYLGGRKVRPLPSIQRHAAMQFPQFRMFEDMLRPYARYDTGAPILDRETGEPRYPKDQWTAPLRLFGFNFIPIDMEQMHDVGYERAYRSWREKQRYEELREEGGVW